MTRQALIERLKTGLMECSPTTIKEMALLIWMDGFKGFNNMSFNELQQTYKDAFGCSPGMDEDAPISPNFLAEEEIPDEDEDDEEDGDDEDDEEDDKEDDDDTWRDDDDDNVLEDDEED